MNRLVSLLAVTLLTLSAHAMLTNPPLPNIDYAFAFLPGVGGLVMHGGWCEPDWEPRPDAWGLTIAGWDRVATNGVPAMIHHSGALDLPRSVMIVCGRTAFTFSPPYTNVTFEFDGVTWQRKADLVTSVGGDVEIAYDSARRLAVAYVAESPTAETWEYNGTNWTQRTTATQPTPVGDGALLQFDPIRSNVVLVADTNTWTYDGTDWSLRASGLPTNTLVGGMAFDAARSNVVLLTTTSETWTWDGTAWTKRLPATSPTPARGFFTLAYDPLRAVSTLFSGEAGLVHPVDTWEWDGTNWGQFVPVPEPAATAVLIGLVFVARKGRKGK